MAKETTQESKAARIRQWLLSGKPLTQWECTQRFLYLDLASLIRDMRNSGYIIETEMVSNKRTRTRYGIYRVIEQPKVNLQTT